MVKKLLVVSIKKNCRIEKIIKRNGNRLYVKWKGYNSSFNSWINKQDCIKMSQYFSPYISSGGNVKVELDLSSYATKTDLKNVTHVDVSNLALKSNLTSLKTETDKTDIDRLEIVPVELSKLRNVVTNNTNKSSDKLVTK